jgi:hypothetical protein
LQHAIAVADDWRSASVFAAIELASSNTMATHNPRARIRTSPLWVW